MVSTPEGQRVAAALIRDGFVPLTRTAAQEYMVGLGASRHDSAGLGKDLTNGLHVIVTDVVGEGRVIRSVTKADGDDDVRPPASHMSKDELDKYIKMLPVDDTLAQQLRELYDRLRRLPKPTVQ
jgi:hypothetical protein